MWSNLVLGGGYVCLHVYYFGSEKHAKPKMRKVLVLFREKNHENLSDLLQVVFTHPLLCFQSCFGDGKTQLKGLFQCKGLVTRTVRMQKS